MRVLLLVLLGLFCFAQALGPKFSPGDTVSAVSITAAIANNLNDPTFQAQNQRNAALIAAAKVNAPAKRSVRDGHRIIPVAPYSSTTMYDNPAYNVGNSTYVAQIPYVGNFPAGTTPAWWYNDPVGHIFMIGDGFDVQCTIDAGSFIAYAIPGSGMVCFGDYSRNYTLEVQVHKMASKTYGMMYDAVQYYEHDHDNDRNEIKTDLNPVYQYISAVTEFGSCPDGEIAYTYTQSAYDMSTDKFAFVLSNGSPRSSTCPQCVHNPIQIQGEYVFIAPDSAKLPISVAPYSHKSCDPSCCLGGDCRQGLKPMANPNDSTQMSRPDLYILPFCATHCQA